MMSGTAHLSVCEAAIRTEMPDSIKAVEKMKAEGGVVFIHQDSFAADCQDRELYLPGAAIKICWRARRGYNMTGKNGDTLKKWGHPESIDTTIHKLRPGALSMKSNNELGLNASLHHQRES
jgi:hypothetical protein